MRQKENHGDTVLVKVEANLKDGYSCSLLGQYVVKKIGYGIRSTDQDSDGEFRKGRCRQKHANSDKKVT